MALLVYDVKTNRLCDTTGTRYRLDEFKILSHSEMKSIVPDGIIIVPFGERPDIGKASKIMFYKLI